MAGCQVDKYGFDLAKRTFTMTFTKNDFPSGNSEIYVPEDRHYPDGFTVLYNDKVILVRDKKSQEGLKLIKKEDGFRKETFRFDATTQRLVIAGWDFEDTQNLIKIMPGRL